MYRLTRYSIPFVFLGLGLAPAAEHTLRLKSRTLDVDAMRAPSAAGPVKRRAAGRSHFLLRFDALPRAEQAREWRTRGVRLLQYVPESGYTAAVDDGVDLDGLNVRAAVRLRPDDKISAALVGRDTVVSHVIVEFHPDVDRAEAEALAVQEGFEVVDHPDIVAGQVLLRGPAERLGALAEWDEVAYVFPASSELEQGRRVHACAGALAGLGTVGQYAGRVSEGWDGVGRGSVGLGYFFTRLTAQIAPDMTRAEILRAMSEWAKYASVSFSPAGAPDASRTLNILFAAGNHGDVYPFDGRSGVLAHTFYPAPPNAEPTAGDMHFDDGEEWVAGADRTIYSIDLYSVALHELGHALGLSHSDYPGTVMYPYYRRVAALAPEDVLRIQELYAAPPATPGTGGALNIGFTSPAVFPAATAADSIALSGSVTGGSGDVQALWASNRGPAGVATGGRSWSVPAVPLYTGDNIITITVTDAVSGRVSRAVTITRSATQAPLAIRIATPAAGGVYVTSNPSVTLTGSADPSGAVARVEWSSSHGSRGTASGAAAWTAGPIALQSGSNVITVTAFDTTGRPASVSLDVSYVPGTPDTVAPSLVITSPASTSVVTYSASIVLRGTAADNRMVTQVSWQTSTGKTGLAAGTANWSTGEIPLFAGANRIVVRAVDAAGNTGWRSVTVTRW